MKKVMLIFVVSTVFCGAAFAQDDWLSISGGFTGYMFIPKESYGEAVHKIGRLGFDSEAGLMISDNFTIGLGAGARVDWYFLLVAILPLSLLYEYGTNGSVNWDEYAKIEIELPLYSYVQFKVGFVFLQMQFGFLFSTNLQDFFVNSLFYALNKDKERTIIKTVLEVALKLGYIFQESIVLFGRLGYFIDVFNSGYTKNIQNFTIGLGMSLLW